MLSDREIISKALSLPTNFSNNAIDGDSNHARSIVSDKIILTKIGCDYENQTLLLQFHTKANKRKKTKRIHIKKFIYKNPAQIIESLKRKFPEYLSNLSVQAEPVLRLSIEKLLFTDREKNHSNNNSKPAARINNNISKSNVVTTEVDEEILLHEVDLNKVPEELNQKAKSLMNREFEAKRLKPGDEGYVWDKQVEFGPAEEANDWDEEDE